MKPDKLISLAVGGALGYYWYVTIPMVIFLAVVFGWWLIPVVILLWIFLR